VNFVIFVGFVIEKPWARFSVGRLPRFSVGAAVSSN